MIRSLALAASAALIPITGWSAVCSLAADGAPIIDGSRRLLIGQYEISSTANIDDSVDNLKSNLQEMRWSVGSSQSAFAALIDRCATKNTHALLSTTSEDVLGSGAVAAWKGKSAVIGWDVEDDADDPTYRDYAAVRAKAIDLEAADPNHFTYLSLTANSVSRRSEADRWCQLTDLVGVQLYTIGNVPWDPVAPADYLSAVYDRAKYYAGYAATYKRCFVPNIQAFSWGSQARDPRMPTALELRNMAWATAAVGARGFFFYSYPSFSGSAAIRSEVAAISTELSSMSNPLLNGVRQELPTSVAKSFATSWTVGSTWWVVVGNTNPSSTASLSLSVPSGITAVSSVFANRPSGMAISAGKLSGSIKPGEVHVYQGTIGTAGNGTGLTGEYFDNVDLTRRVLTRTDAAVDFTWGTGSPAGSIAADTFSVRWSGEILPRYTETYTFTTTSDDGIRLKINNQSLIDQWNDHSPTQHSGTIALTAGTKYSISLEYYERGGDATARLAWSSPSQAVQTVPASQLFPKTAPAFEAPFSTGDIGAVGAAGSGSETNGVWTLKGSGEDIWNTTDEFRFAFRQITGDATVTARITGITNAHPWAKAGVMLRSTVAGNAAHALCAVTPTNGVAYQRRLSAGGGSLHTSGSASAAPRWVRLRRSGSTITAAESADGITWTTIGSDTISLGSSIQAGVVVTSHADGTLCTATCDQVTVTP